MITKDEAIKLLRGGKEGIKEWNRRRDAGEEIPNLSGVMLAGARLGGPESTVAEGTVSAYSVRGADLSHANLSSAILIGTGLQHADLEGANLDGAHLFEANLADVDLCDATLRSASLMRANLSPLRVSETTDLTGAIFGGTNVNCDVSIVKGINGIQHFYPSHVAVNAILDFQGELPETFLRGCGIREDEIAYFRGVVGKPIRFFSCFISYTAKDEAFATRLHNDFQAVGIRCWKWTHDAKTGEPFFDQINQVLRVYDKVLLIASKQSLNSHPVQREIERAIQEEGRRKKLKAAEGGKLSKYVLFPVAVDRYIYKESKDGTPVWDHPCRPDIMDRYIADAVGWDKDDDKYQAVLARLIRDLKDEPEAT